MDDSLDREADRIQALGLAGVILFGIPAAKDPVGNENFADDGIVQQALRRLRKNHPDLLLITDVCCCEYTDHGHCGIIKDGVGGQRRDARGARQGCREPRRGRRRHGGAERDDGRHGGGHPRGARRRGLQDRAIMSYAVKYASAFYGPFREAAESAPAFGDRRQYQMDPANVREGLLEAALDEREGADMIMVKPALAYLDVIRAVRERTELPLVAYNVSGEYSMVKAAARLRLDRRAAHRARGAHRHAPRRRRRDHLLPLPRTWRRGSPRRRDGDRGARHPRDSAASEQLFAEAQRVSPGRRQQPGARVPGVGGTPRFIARGEGAWLVDADGNRYLDLVLSWGPLILGHAHPDVLEAVIDRGAVAPPSAPPPSWRCGWPSGSSRPFRRSRWCGS